MINIDKEMKYAEKAAAIIKKRTKNFKPKVAIVLGSGLGKVAESIENGIEIPYHDLPHFQVSSIPGHAHKLSFGMLKGVPVVCLEGRAHAYEGPEALVVIRNVMNTLKIIGCEVLLSTNSVGSLRKEVGVGELVAISDHINLTFINPLTGVPKSEFGPLFVSMDDAYNGELRAKMHEVAKENDLNLHDGVFMATSGPTFETHAEIRAYKTLGADIIGMSTVPDTIAARKVGLKVVTVSVVTNLAAGLSDTKLSHEGTLSGAKQGMEKLIKLLLDFIPKI